MNSNKTNSILGIDIGGTNIKSAIISSDGKMTGFSISSTSDWVNSGNFIDQLAKFINKQYKHGIIGCGIAVPGMVDYEGNRVFMVNAIPCLNDIYIRDEIQYRFPELDIIIENDSNAAAYGEFFNVKDRILNELLFITMGTGIGCGLILDGVVFKGGSGGAMELGLTLTDNNESLDDAIGIKGIERIAHQKKIHNNNFGIDVLHSISDIIKLSNLNDKFAEEVMFQAGTILGKSLVNVIWLFDVKNIVIGGGVAEAFSSIESGINHIFKQFFPEDILNEIRLSKAITGNNAGLIGAALLCFSKINKK